MDWDNTDNQAAKGTPPGAPLGQSPADPSSQGDGTWSRLELLLGLAELRGIRVLSGEEVLELGALYRRATARLSFSRTYHISGAQRDYLNSLVTRAYGQLYRTAYRPRSTVRSFIREDFPQTFRLNWRFFAVAFLVTLLGAGVGVLASYRDGEAADVLLGPGTAQEVEQVAQRHSGSVPHNWLPDEERPMASVLIITNNARVSAAALAFGILGGIGTLVVLWYNGLLLGLVGYVVHARHADLDFWSFVLPHGVLELTAVFIAGASGLMLGYALLFPGRLYRLDALKLAGRQAAKLLMGAAILLLPAGLIEAFFSPLAWVPHPLKLGLAVVSGITLYAYLMTSGRSEAEMKPGWGLRSSPIQAWIARENESDTTR